MSKDLNCPLRTCRRIWKRALECKRDDEVMNVCCRKKRRCGRKKININLEALKELPYEERHSELAVASALGVSRTVVRRELKEKKLEGIQVY